MKLLRLHQREGTGFRRQLAKIRQVWAAVAHHQRCYPALPVPAEQAIHHGPIGKIKDVVAEYAASGLDLLVLMPEVRSVQQLALLRSRSCPSTSTDAHPAGREVQAPTSLRALPGRSRSAAQAAATAVWLTTVEL